MDSDSFSSLFSDIYSSTISVDSIITINSTVLALSLLVCILAIVVVLLLFNLPRATKCIDKIFNKEKQESDDNRAKTLELSSDELPKKKEILRNISALQDKTAVEIMTPRMDVADLCIKAGFQEVTKLVATTGFSRIPVFGENKDDIRGILYSKDLLPYINKYPEFDWQSLIRLPYFVPENKKIDELLEDFRKNKFHLAVVVDEFGGVSGIVTLEDILEEIVGEIDDEHDEENQKYIELADGSFIFYAKILLTDFFRVTQINPKEFGEMEEEADTLAGLILEIKGDFPERKEVVRYKNYSFRILEMDKKRILKVKFSTKEQTETD